MSDITNSPAGDDDFHAHVLHAAVAPADYSPFEDGPEDTADIVSYLTDRGYRVSLDDGSGTRVHPVDVIIADCRAETFDHAPVCARFAALRRNHPESVFLILIDPDLGWDSRMALKRYGTLCPVGERADLIVPRLDRLLENLTLADECGERLKTLSSLNRSAGGGSILETNSKPLQVLMAGAPSPVTLRAMRSMKEGGFDVVAAMSVAQTARYLESDRFDCLVVLPGNRVATYTGLVKMLRRNDRTRTLPILVIPERADQRGRTTGTRFMAQGADTILTAEDAEQALNSEVTAFARRNRLTASMKQFLRKAASVDGTGQSLVSDLTFFERHLHRLCDRADNASKPLCLSAFKLTHADGSRLSQRLFDQAIAYAQMIIRETDLIAAVRQDIFLVSQPGLIASEAARRQANIADVLQEIAFESDNGAGSERLALSTSTVQYAPGEGSRTLISRAFRRMAPKAARREEPLMPDLRIVH